MLMSSVSVDAAALRPSLTVRSIVTVASVHGWSVFVKLNVCDPDSRVFGMFCVTVTGLGPHVRRGWLRAY